MENYASENENLNQKQKMDISDATSEQNGNVLTEQDEPIVDSGTNPAEQPVIPEPPKPFYKKTWFWGVIVVVIGLVLAITYGDYGKRNELISYNNEQISPLIENFIKVDEEFIELIENGSNDALLAEKLEEEIIPEIEGVLAKIKEISPKNEQIKELHDICIDSCTQYKDSIVMLAESLSEQDEEKFEKAHGMYESAIERMKDYMEKREELRKEFKIDVQ